MRLLLIALLLLAVPAFGQFGGDSRFWRNAVVSRDSLLVDLRVGIDDGKAAVDTIENTTGKGVAIQYGANGTDSSGVSYDPETGTWGIALDGSAGDSVILKLSTFIDSLDWQTHSVQYGAKNLTQHQKDFYVTRLDTSGASVAANYVIILEQRADTLAFASASTDGTAITVKVAGIFNDTEMRQFTVLQTSVSPAKLVLYVDNDSTAGIEFTGTKRLRRTNVIRMGGLYQSGSYKPIGNLSDIRVYRRALSQKEILRLYAESTDLNARRRFSRY
jgi:hypothetical protein